jgi:hypothetical protein
MPFTAGSNALTVEVNFEALKQKSELKGSGYASALRITVSQQGFYDRCVESLSLCWVKLIFSYWNYPEQAHRPFRQTLPRTFKVIFRDRRELIDAIAIRVVVKVIIERAIEKILLSVVSRDEDPGDVVEVSITNGRPIHSKLLLKREKLLTVSGPSSVPGLVSRQRTSMATSPQSRLRGAH